MLLVRFENKKKKTKNKEAQIKKKCTEIESYSFNSNKTEKNVTQTPDR